MRIQFASDLHLEYLARQGSAERIVRPAPGAEVLVLAGDIHNGVAGVHAFADWPVPVLYVPGNHEYYDQSWPATRAALRAASVGTAVTVLDNGVAEWPGVRFLGCTLWTDFAVYGEPVAQALATCERRLTDYRVIRTEDGPLRAAQALADHRAARAWLAAELARPFPGRTVVVSHHAPHPASIHARFAGHPINPGYVSDLTPLLHQADGWLHGHTHDRFDYRVGRCRVLANPAGYVRLLDRWRPGQPLELENAAFDPAWVIDLETDLDTVAGSAA